MRSGQIVHLRPPLSPTRASQGKGRLRGNAEQQCSRFRLSRQVMLSVSVRAEAGAGAEGGQGGEAGGGDLPRSPPDPLYVHTARRTTGAGSRGVTSCSSPAS